MKKLIIGTLLLALIIISGIYFSKIPSSSGKSKPSTPSESTSTKGVIQNDTVLGTGEIANPGDKISVHYTGWLDNGQKTDSSRDRGKPFVFVLGTGQVIRGWDQGIIGMKVGGKRQLVIPPELGYGAAGAEGIVPPNSNLHYDFELISVVSAKDLKQAKSPKQKKSTKK